MNKTVNVKEQLLHAAMNLLRRKEADQKITARALASEAGVNLAMISYYYDSKDELLYQAALALLKQEADAWVHNVDASLPPYQRLRQMLIEMSHTTMRYMQFTSISLEHELIKADIVLPYYILPLIREICGNACSEYEMRLIACDIMCFLQLLFLRHEAFAKYAGSDLQQPEERVRMITTLLDLHLGKYVQDRD